MEKAFINKDWEALSTLAHRLRGAEMFGYPTMGDVAGELEDLIKRTDYEKALLTVESLKKISKRIQLGIQNLPFNSGD